MGAVDRRRADVADLARLLWELLCGGPYGDDLPSGRVTSLLGSRRRGARRAVDDVARRGHERGAGFDSVAELVLAWRTAMGCTERGCSRRCCRTRHLVGDAASPRTPRGGERAGRTCTGVSGRSARSMPATSSVGNDVTDGACSNACRAAVHGGRRVGSGESSVLHAGLVRAGARSMDCGSSRWCEARIGRRAARAALSEVPLRRCRRLRPDAAVRAVADDAPRLVIVVDEFEECWTTAAPAARRRSSSTHSRRRRWTCRSTCASCRPCALISTMHHCATRRSGTLLAAGTFAIRTDVSWASSTRRSCGRPSALRVSQVDGAVWRL